MPKSVTARGTYFYPRSPCGERRVAGQDLYYVKAISIHALLAESDKRLKIAQWAAGKFLSTLSLRRATSGTDFYRSAIEFLSTLSLRRATKVRRALWQILIFLSTLSLRRATRVTMDSYLEFIISIHALLAESDCGCCARCRYWAYFYPRSPCGERHQLLAGAITSAIISIHALLAESDRFAISAHCFDSGISIHALLAESDTWARGSRVTYVEFLSTLSLRRATSSVNTADQEARISIHALLAESDLWVM